MSFQALLFCQDEKTTRTVTQVLSELDFQVDACSETFAAVKKLTSQKFEAIVVDCQNEENAGLLLKTARNSASNQSALMVAVVEGQAGVAAAFRIGANLVLTKPIAIEQARGTLRVARGLLRKNATPAANGATLTPANAAPAETRSADVPVPAAATSASTPARIAIPSAQTLPKSAAPAVPFRAMPPIPRPLPLQPTASLAPGAFGKLESEKELHQAPDAASAGLMEAIDFSKKAESEVVSFAEISPATIPSIPSVKPAPVPMKTLGGTFGAAAAPAREVHPLPAITTDLVAPFETVANTHAEPAFVPAETTNEEESVLSVPTSQSSKKPLIVVAILLVLGAAAYWGWSQLQSHPASTPMAAPQATQGTNFPPTFSDPALTASQSAQAPKDKVQPSNAQPDAPQSENRFIHSAVPVAPDSVATNRVPVPVPVHTTTPAHSKSLQIKTKLQRVDNSAARQDAAPEPPSMAGITGTANTQALSAIAASTSNALPTVAAESHRISQGVSDGLLLKRVQPAYPSQALQMHIEGTVVLQATIGKDGSIKNVKALSGPPILERAASDAVRQWKYRPYTLNGQPVEIDTQVSVAFKAPR